MPTIPISDQLGLTVDAQLAPTAALIRYLQQIPKLQFNSLDFSKIGGLTLDDPAVQSLTTGLAFQQPVSLGSGPGAPALTIGAGVSGSFEVGTKPELLPDGDDDGGAGGSYLSVKLNATASAGVSATSGMLTFGALPSTTVEIATCSRFPPKSGLTLLEAIEETVGAILLPATIADLQSLAPGQSVRVGVSGKLQLSGAVNLLAVTNPLATATLPSPLPAPSVSAGGTVTVGAACTVATDYDVVARRLDNGAVRVGWYRKHSSEVSVTAAASEGITAGFGTTDLFSTIIAAVSASPQADLKELQSAGVPAAQIEAIQKSVQAAVARNLAIAVSAALTFDAANSAAFLYDVVPGQLNDASRAAVRSALRGDLSVLHAGGALPGVTCVRSVWDEMKSRSIELNVNLLGVLNMRSVASLALEGKVLYEPASGALVLTDSATAQRVQSTQVNFGADTDKLRRVLAESFLITAAYHGSQQAMEGPTFRCSQSFFELDASTSRSDMAPKLRTGVALGVLDAAGAAMPAGVDNFGRTVFLASGDYDDKSVAGMFLDSNESALPRALFEQCGRDAIQFLVQSGDTDELRLRPAIDDSLWGRMTAAGQPGIPGLFPGASATDVAAITADYTTIQWWADAMTSTAGQLAAMRAWLRSHPSPGPNDPEFQELRQGLAAHLEGVAANTRNEFGQPWGLITVSRLVGRSGGARMLLTGPVVTIDKRRAAVAGMVGG